MASFTDTQQAYLTPYTPGVDVGMYAATLQYKQNQYDTGVQRVQSAIDNVAGLEVYRPIDKQYLEGKMGQLQTDLNSIAGSDFSNQSVVSQAQGLASRIVKDENVQRALISTQGIKALLADQKDLKDKHPELYSAANEWYDSQGVNSYLNSQEIGESYKGSKQATRYFEWQKPIKETLDKLGPEVTYKINSDGQFQYFVDKSSKIRPADIENLVNGMMSSDPRIQQQMNIDGGYTYKDYDAPSLLNHINNFYGSQIGQNQAMIEMYKQKKLADPTNSELATQLDNFIADTQRSVDVMSTELNRYKGYFATNKNISNIKQTFFNDEVRKRYVANYQKDDHELDIKTNASATGQVDMYFKQQNLALAQQDNAVAQSKLKIDMITAGVNPETGQAITAEDPYYQHFINANLKSFSDMNGGMSGTGGANTPGMPNAGNGFQFSSTAGGSTPNNPYTYEDNRDKINTVQASIDSVEVNNQQYYAQISGGTQGTKEFADSYKSWVATQEQKLANGEKVDDNYLRNKVRKQDFETQVGALTELDKTISADVVKLFPQKEYEVDVPGVTKFNSKNAPGFVNTYVKFSGEVQRAIDAYADSPENTTKDSKGISHKNLTVSKTQKDRILKEVADKYANDPNYSIFKKVAAGGTSKFEQANKAIVEPIKPTVQARRDEMNKRYAAKGQTLNYPTTIISGKPEVINAYKNVVVGALKANAGDEKIEIDVDKLNVVDGYWDEKNQQHIRYTTGKDSNLEDVIIPSDRPMVGRPDPYYRVEQAIEASPLGMTPVTGTGVRVSSNGKVRYSIGKNPGGGGYLLYILDGANKIPLNTGVDANGNPRPLYTNIKEVIDKVNKLSVFTDPATKQQLNPQQLLEWVRKNNQSQ